MRRFPRYQSHDLAAAAGCFSCGRQLGGRPVDSGFPPGRGRFSQECPCGFATFYDLRSRRSPPKNSEKEV